ncbi:MAG: OmpH family outer membrane protein [Vicinamibacterales bacterium]
MRPLKTMIAISAASVALSAGPVSAQTPPATAQPAAQTPPADQKPTTEQKPAPPAPAKPTPPPAAPQPFPEGAKIAYISLQYIASNSVEGKAATAKIQEFAKKKGADLTEKGKALEALRQKLLQGGTVLSDQARGQMEKDIDKMNRELQFEQQSAQAEQTQLTQDLQNDFQTRLNPIIDQVAKEKGLHLVLSIDDSGAVWANTGLNISAEVMTRLDAAAKAPAAPAKK